MKKERCESITRRYARRCKNPAIGRANGLDVCGVHKRRIERTFAEAKKRWIEAGEPESDL